MPLTKEQAITETYFHYEGSVRSNGSCKTWRRNGMTKTWKTRPEEYRIPVKYGLRAFDYITHEDAQHVHLERDCPNTAS